MKIDQLDHLVLTIRSVKVAIDFYSRVLGMEVVAFGEGRKALRFGSQKINLHEQAKEFEPKAHRPTPGSAAPCFLTSVPLRQVQVHPADQGVVITEGPIRRAGAVGSLLSVYVRDPDESLKSRIRSTTKTFA